MTILKNKNIIEVSNEIINKIEEKEQEQYKLSSTNYYKKNQGKIEQLIYEINGKQVMLDSDLAILYGCKNGTKEINQAVKNNIEKFPERFSWVLSKEDSESFLVKNFDQKNIETRGGKYKKPRVFTEQGVAMLATIIKSDIATEVSIKIMDAFVYMRHCLANNSFLLESNIKIRNELDNQKRKLLEHDEKIEVLFSKFENKEQKELLFFNGQFYDAYSKIVDILKLAKKDLIIIDGYADKSVLEMISKIKVNVILVIKQNKSLNVLDIEKYKE